MSQHVCAKCWKVGENMCVARCDRQDCPQAIPQFFRDLMERIPKRSDVEKPDAPADVGGEGKA